MLKFKEGQTYICTNAAFAWWTEGKEYKVFNHREFNVLVMEDDSGSRWSEDELRDSLNEFKLKDEPKTPKFDLNKLTHEELRIYIELVDALSDANNDLHEFINTHTK